MLSLHCYSECPNMKPADIWFPFYLGEPWLLPENITGTQSCSVCRKQNNIWHLGLFCPLPHVLLSPALSERETDHSLVGLWSWNTSWRAPGFHPALELFGRWDTSVDMLVPSSPPGIQVAADSSLPAVLNTRDYWHRCGLPSCKEEPGLFCLSLNLKKSPFWSCFPLHISPDKGLSSSSPAL